MLSWLPRWRGEHQVRTGVQFQHAPYGQDFDSLGHGDLVARYRNGVPDSVTVYNTPVSTSLEPGRARRVRAGLVDDRAAG